MRNKIIPYRKDLKEKARELRKNGTLSEVLLWVEIKNRQVLGFQFHRQVPLLNYIVDFYCHELQLAIEIDGDSHSHELSVSYDAKRQLELENYNIKFLRFDDLDVKKNIGYVIDTIENWIHENDTPLPPSRGELKKSSLKGEFNKVPPQGGRQGGVTTNTNFIKSIAASLGFSFCGISKAEFLEADAPRLEEWLKRGYHGKMKYMENHFDKRLDPTKLVPGAKSVVSLVYNYFPEKELTNTAELKIARYAYGEDYHTVIKDKLKTFMEKIQKEIGEVHGRAFVDSGPVMERTWAQKSGTGWVGKNSLLLNKSMGSFFFLAELILDLELAYDGPVQDYCGTCTACMDACPTDAIPQPYVVDGSKCISYFTIELKDEIPASAKGKFENWVFGCDICQEVCPWNRFSKPHQETRFTPNPELEKMTRADWQDLTEEVFQKVFKKSAVKRTKLEGLKRNIRFVTN